ncbi:MAG TPA: cytosine permease [Mycobacteriales bacterium]|jgi:NCS1 family nucleobase:cation symporter-1|nr:cytosine permease [Mycobacteriales bacterium]
MTTVTAVPDHTPAGTADPHTPVPTTAGPTTAGPTTAGPTTAGSATPGRRRGRKAVSVEAGGAEPIALSARHGRPFQQALMWTSPNMEFATVFVGALGVLVFGLSFWTAVAAIVLGNALGALFHGLLATWGPQTGLGQMALGRKAFGFWGNLLPAGFNSILGGMGWLAVNSVSGALALSTLAHWNPYLCLVIAMSITLTIAFFGHDAVQALERFAFPVLTVVFAVGVVLVMLKTNPSAAHHATPGAFWIVFGASFGYTGGWMVNAADYARYLRPDQARKAGFFAGLGNFTSSTVLQIAGAAAVTAVGVSSFDSSDPVSSYASLLPGWLGQLTLAAVFLGALSANSLNLYSSALSFAAMGISLPTRFARAIIALVIGFVALALALAVLKDTSSFGDFLLVTAYWIGPWLGVVLADRLLNKPQGDVLATLTDRGHRNWAGPISMVVAGVVSIALFCNQTAYVGLLARSHPGLGDLTFEVGIALAFGLYALLRPVFARR